MAAATSPAPVALNSALQAPLKLTSSNYTSWRFQFQTLLTGYDLMGYVDGSKPCPPATITTAATTVTAGAPPAANPAHSLWIRQDQLILSAIISTVSPSLIPFIAAAKTSRDAWLTFAKTYGKPSQGRILALKNRLHNPTKGAKSITDYLQEIKGVVDELALIGVAIDAEDLTLKILNGLDMYKK